MNRTPDLAPVRPRAPTWPGPARRADGLLWIAAVAAAYTVVQLALAVFGTGLGWDESVYVSQVARGSEAAFFSAPRARGITFLVAPVTALTSSVEVLRVFLAVLSGAGLFAALAVWRTLLPPRVLALAGGLFAGLWITVFYGPQVMPNLWVALGALFTVGCFLRAARDPFDRAGLLGTGAGLVFVALMRPSDAVWLLLPLAAVALLSRAARRPALLVALAAGTVLGCLPWIVEAYVAYDGLLARLRRAGEIQGHLGPHFAVDDQLRALEGRSLCRPCDVPWRKPVAAVWFLVLWPLAAGGAAVAARRRCPFTAAPTAVRPSAVLVPALVGLSLAVPYLLLIGYAAPRFLLPAYALLALPVAVCLGRIAASARPRAAAAVVLGLALAGHLTVQYAVLNGTMERSRNNHKAFDRIVSELRRNGVREPCVVSGSEAPRIALRAGCASRQIGGHDGSITRTALARLGEERAVAYVVEGHNRPPSFTRGWRLLTLPGLPSRPELRAYVSRAAGPPGTGR
ncbi:hypothetical protein [Streptomyces sp. V1I6]|uniref:hypothetical protein n=1 Tax=Streptomyces sp. V1I6 TaxID=3042273 RepID=UPI00278B916D|nr:hypothetical protein [Streptomyces sp. V1I6]MDQ0841743.1 hypothetical protein [Streptomyces sp. V1I6]